MLEISAVVRKDLTDQIMGQAIHQSTKNDLAYPGRWLLAFANCARAMKEHSKLDAFSTLSKVFESNMRNFAKRVFKQISGPERAEAISGLFKQKMLFYPACDLLRHQYHASKTHEHERDEKFYLSDDELEEIISIHLKFYQSLKPEELRATGYPYDILYCWKSISGDSSGPEKILMLSFEKDDELLETLDSLRYLSSSAQRGIPHIPEAYLKDFIDTKQLKARLEKMAGSESEHAARANDMLKLWWPAE